MKQPITIAIDGSFDRGTHTGGWAIAALEKKTTVFMSGGLALGRDNHYCECYALLKALAFAKQEYSPDTPLHIISDSKNALHMLEKQIQNRILINYRRVPPWDLMKEYIRHNPNITGEFKGKYDDQVCQDVHFLAKKEMQEQKEKVLNKYKLNEAKRTGDWTPVQDS